MRNLTAALGRLNGLDIYGHPIGVQYRGGGTFTTKLGGLVTIATLVFIVLNTVNIVSSFVNKTDQSEFYQRLKTDMTGM